MDYYQALDSELFESCQQDDIRAFNELFRRYSPVLYKQANRYIVNQDVAEELMLDILFNIWEKRHSRHIEGDISAYLYRCMRNKIVDHRRRIIPKMIPIEECSLLDNLIGTSNSDDTIMNDDVEKVYNLALEMMSPQRRKVFQLSREEDCSYKEIAHEMDLSINTVENYMTSALVVFRKHAKAYLNLAVYLIALQSLFF